MSKYAPSVFTLPNDNYPDTRFEGYHVAGGDSRTNSQPRWTEINLYRTELGTHIAHVIGRTVNEGERDRYRVHICGDATGVVNTLGHGPLAKHIYQMAGIDGESVEWVA